MNNIWIAAWTAKFVIWSTFWASALSAIPPKLNPLLFPMEHAAGMTARVSCTAYAGDTPLSFRWLKDGNDLPKELPHTSRQLDDYTASLNLGPLEESHVGNYTCIVSNSGGSDASTAALFVKVPPSWLVEPFDTTVHMGEDFQLPCLATGSPKPQVTWTKNDRSLSLTELRWKVHENGSLFITKATKDSSGSYTCRSSNGVEDALVKTVLVTVWIRPKVQQKYISESIEKGKDAVLLCSAEGDQPLTFNWLKDKMELANWPSLLHRIKREDDVQSNFTISRLYISQSVIQDAGVFNCTVHNKAGEDSMTIHLTVTEKPAAPVDLEVSDFWSRDIRMRWTPPYTGSSAILHYLVEFWDVSDPSGEHKNLTFVGVMNSLTLKDLSPATTYRLRMWAMNAVGPSLPSEQIQFTTSEEAPSGSPLDVRVDNSGATFARVSWKVPDRRKWNGQLEGFYVGYKSLNSKSPYSFYTAPFSNTSNQFVLRGLQRSTSYHLVVKAFNRVGTGPASPELLIRTKDGEAPPRPMLTVLSVEPTSLHLKASTITSDFPVSGYTVYYKELEGELKEIKILRTTEENKFTIGSLDSGKLYQIYVVSLGAFGESEPSETVSIRTAYSAGQQLAPPPPASPPQHNSDEVAFMQTMYIVIPVVIATVIIVAIVVGACLYVYYRRTPRIHLPYSVDMQKEAMMHYTSTLKGRSKDPFCPYTPSQRHHNYDHPMQLERQYGVQPAQQYGTHYPNNYPNHRDGDWTPQQTPRSAQHRMLEPNAIDEEPIYESVMDEMRTIMRQRGQETLQKSKEVII